MVTRDTCFGCQETEVITWDISNRGMEECWSARDRLDREEWEGSHMEGQRGKADVTSCCGFPVQS